MTSTQNVIPVHFPATPKGSRKTKAIPAPKSATDHLRGFSEKAVAHPDAEIIAASVEYCVAAAGAWAAYAPDPTDSLFSAVIDIRLLRPAPIILAPRSRLQDLREPGADVMLAVRSALPVYLNRDQRDEVEAAMLLAYYEGQLRLEDVTKRVREFVSGMHRMFPTTFARGGINAPASLDAPAYRDSQTPLVSTISRGLWQ